MAKKDKFSEVEAQRFLDACVEHRVTPPLDALFETMETPDEAKARIEQAQARKQKRKPSKTKPEPETTETPESKE